MHWRCRSCKGATAPCTTIGGPERCRARSCRSFARPTSGVFQIFLMRLHLSQHEWIIMAAAGVGCSYVGWVGIIGVMGCVVGAAGYGADKAASFGVPDITYIRKLQGSAVKAHVMGLRGLPALDTALGLNHMYQT